jgi:hypothetical protein
MTGVELVKGTVTDDSVAALPVIELAGETGVGVPSLASYTPTNGDRPWVLIAGGTRLCLGV